MTLSLIKKFELNKEQIAAFVEKASDEVLDGNHNPMTVIANLKAMEDCIQGIRKNIMDAALTEAAKYGKTSKVNGIEYTITNRKTYDYSCSERWLKLREETKALETMLKALTQPVADPETGEIINPPTFKVTESLTVTLP